MHDFQCCAARKFDDLVDPKPTTPKLATMLEFFAFGNDGEIGLCSDIDLIFNLFLSL